MFKTKRIICKVDKIKGLLQNGHYDVMIDTEKDFKKFLKNPNKYCQENAIFIIDDFTLNEIGEIIDISEQEVN